MAEVKLTKNELRSQEKMLSQLLKYLPTLQLKKAMLQSEVNEARQEIKRLEEAYQTVLLRVNQYSALLADKASIDLDEVAKLEEIKTGSENIAGVEIPVFESCTWVPYLYDLFETPPWVDSAIAGLRELTVAKVKIDIGKEKKRALEKELREVSIRVNLFEKILIPRALKNTKKSISKRSLHLPL